MPERISRRTMLKGAGAALSLPFLEAMLPARTAGAARPPVRLGIVTVTGGTVIESWKPAAEGKLPDRLPSILRPLEFARDDLLVLSGLSHNGKVEGLNGHEHCASLHLTGATQARKVGGKIVSGMSVDQAAAAAVGERTYLPSLEIGYAVGEQRFSYRTPEQPVPYEANPRLVFERMFRGRAPVLPDWTRPGSAASAVRASARPGSHEQSVIDLVTEQAKDLQGRLGAADKRKLDEYLHSVRAVEKRIGFVESRQAEDLKDLTVSAEWGIPARLPRPGMPLYEITSTLTRDPERHGDYVRLMSDLLVLAFQTDTTRVATLAVGSDEAHFPGVVTVGYETHAHTLEHQGNAGRVEDADPIAREGCRQIHAWYTALFAETLRKLKSVEEPGGSLLDNCLIVYTSYMADGNHGTRDYPVVLAGKAGGTLKPGRHVAYKPKTPMSNLFVELLDRVGAKADSFGESGSEKVRAYDGRLPGLG